MSTLPLSSIASVTYNIPGVGAARQGFNLGLIMGTSTIISTATRVTKYTSLADMVTAGFSLSSPEYLAAQRYFAATSNPTQVLIGAIGTGETPLEAITDARAKNNDWYMAYIPSATNTDHTAIAAYIEALEAPYSQYIFQSSDAAVLNATAGNIFETCKTSAYKRTHGLYSTNLYAAAGIMGYAMGQTSDFVNSAYTLKFKTIPGATTESMTTQQVTNVEGNNGNVYVNRASAYDMYEPGVQFSGDWFDEIIYLDKLANDIQISIANLLYNTPKIPQTEDGMAQIRAVASASCEKLKQIGFIAPGKWNGGSILTLNTGDYLPGGYLVMSDSIDSQDQTDRDARKAPKVYVATKLAGAIQTAFFQINVNR